MKKNIYIFKRLVIKYLEIKLKNLTEIAGDMDACYFYFMKGYPNERAASVKRTIVQMEIESVEDKLSKLKK